MARPTAQILCAVFCQLCVVVWGLQCHQESACRCTFDNGTVIDLDSMSSPGDASFKNKKANNTNDTANYFYNPCYPFTFKDTGCTNVAVCQKTSDGQYFSLGRPASARFIYDEITNSMVIEYNEAGRSANVSLLCSPEHISPDLVVLGETIPNVTAKYQMILFSVCACPNGCVERFVADDGLSTGSILIILVLVIFLTYLLGGMVFKHFVQGATGWETIPNHEFWFGLPALIRDGVTFVMSGCKVEETYDRI